MTKYTKSNKTNSVSINHSHFHTTNNKIYVDREILVLLLNKIQELCILSWHLRTFVLWNIFALPQGLTTIQLIQWMLKGVGGGTRGWFPALWQESPQLINVLFNTGIETSLRSPLAFCYSSALYLLSSLCFTTFTLTPKYRTYKLLRTILSKNKLMFYGYIKYEK